MANSFLIEPLEARIAPATFVNTSLVIYTDGDGDLVKVQSSQPIFHKDLREFTFTANGQGEELSELRLGSSASGTNLTVKVIESSASSNGTADVGFINAKGFDLRFVEVDGRLDRISAGDNNLTSPAIANLHVATLGLLVDDQRSFSEIKGDVGVLRVDTDLDGSVFKVRGNLGRAVIGGSVIDSSILVNGPIGKLKVAGDVVGSAGDQFLTVRAETLGTLVVGGSIIGGNGNNTGEILVRGTLGIAKVGGSIVGGSGDYSGTIGAGAIGFIVVEGDIVGGTSLGSGGIFGGSIAKLVIGGSILGGSGNVSGGVKVGGTIGNIQVGGSVVGASGIESGVITAKGSEFIIIRGNISGGTGWDSGGITISGSKIGSLSLAGSLIGGIGDSSGAIRAQYIASLDIGGNVTGGDGDYSGVIEGSGFGDVHIQGSLEGGSGEFSGTLRGRAATHVHVDKNLVGGSGLGSGAVNLHGTSTVNVTILGDVREVFSIYTENNGMDPLLFSSGSILANRLGTLHIGGSIIAAERAGVETQITSYAILAATSIGRITIGGSIDGVPMNIVGITGGAQPDFAALQPGEPALGIKSLRVHGSATYAAITAGYAEHEFYLPVRNVISFNPDARIGDVRIDGDLTASSITAGVHAGDDRRFGTSDDFAETSEPTEIKSRIASIIVGGRVAGTSIDGDAFGIAAQRILSMTIGGVPVPLTSALDTIQLAPNTDDVLLREHA